MLRELNATTEPNRNAYRRTVGRTGGFLGSTANAAWAPALTILSVRRTSANFDVSLWSSITSLVLFGGADPELPWDGLYCGLRRAGLLEELTIDKVRLSHGMPIADEMKVHTGSSQAVHQYSH
jgi:hypothetical protein